MNSSGPHRIERSRLACSCCERITQAALPSRPIERGRPGPGLLAHLLVNKYADHCPLYRQSQIFERNGNASRGAGGKLALEDAAYASGLSDLADFLTPEILTPR